MLPPALAITNLAFSRAVLNAEDSAELAITLKNTGPGEARDIKIKLGTDGQGLEFPAETTVEKLASGAETVVKIPVRALLDMPDQARVSLNVQVEEPRFKVKLTGKPVSFATARLKTPELVLARFAATGAEGQPRILVNQMADVTLIVQNVGAAEAREVRLSVETAQQGVMALGRVVGGEVKPGAPVIERIEAGKFVQVTYRYFLNSEFQGKELRLTIQAREGRDRGSLKVAKTIAIDSDIAPQGEVRVVQGPVGGGSRTVLERVPDLLVDVDHDIPQAIQENRDAIAVVIGNRDYQRLPRVEYALNDAQVMRAYLQRTFGLKEGNIFFESNASKATFERLFGIQGKPRGKLFNAVKPGKSDVYVFYSGHGAPGLKEGEGYFVPVDADAQGIELQGYPVDTLYANLKELPARSVTMILDTCFSGQIQLAENRVGLLHQGVSPALLPVKKANLSGARAPTLLFASSQPKEVSAWYPEKKHGLFTYFFLKAVHEKNADTNRDGLLTAGELFDYVKDNSEAVPYYARRLHDVEQVPDFSGDAGRVLVRYR